MKLVSRGYEILQDDDVEVEPWSIAAAGGSPMNDPKQIEDWSYAQALEISIAISGEGDALRRRLHLGAAARLGLVIIWTCAGTSLRGASAVAPIVGAQTAAHLILDGSLLRRDVKLECQVILLQASPDNESETAPNVPGAILWSTSCSLLLEGAGARMPIVALPFSRHLTAVTKNAMWWLRIEGHDLDAPADGVLWLWLNEENASIQDMIARPSSSSSKLVAAMMTMDLQRQLVAFALNQEDFDADAGYEEGSLGAVLSAPIRLFNERTVALRARFRDDPQRVEAELQARLGGLGG